MCLTCGCMDAHREMGKANITYEDVKAAAGGERPLGRRDARHHGADGAEGPRRTPAGVRDRGAGARLTDRDRRRSPRRPDARTPLIPR